MIRRWLHGRFLATCDGQAEAILRVVMRHDEGWHWPHRYFVWHVDRFGDNEPWWIRPIGRFVCWVSDWQATWHLRPGGSTS